MERCVGDDDGDDLPSNHRPGRVPEQKLLNPKLGFLVSAELCIIVGKILRAPGVFGENRILMNFWEFSGKVDFCTKIDTKGSSTKNKVSPC